MESIFNKKIASDPSDEIMTICADPPCIHMTEEIMGSKIHSYRNPYDLSAPPMPGNYLDFMNLVYVAIENDTIDNIPYLKKKIDVRNVRDLFTKHYGEYCLARRGLKYFAFYTIAKAENKKDFFINKENIIKEFTMAGTDIQNIFLSLAEKIKSENTTLSELLDKNFNNCLSNLTLSTIKLEEILKIQSYSSLLGFENNINKKDENKMENSNEFFGHQHTLYQYLVTILKSIDETLKNPKTSEGTETKEGMVTKEELASALSKIVPGISEDELTKILKNYSTLNEVELKLVNYVLKSDFENRLLGFVTSEQAQNFANKSEIPSEEVIDNKLNSSDADIKFATKEEVSKKLDKEEALQTYASQNWVTNKINEASLGGDRQDIDLSAYALNTTVDTKVENIKNELTTNIETRLTEAQANEKYAKKDEIPSIDNLATKEEVNQKLTKDQADALYAKVDNIPSIDGLASSTDLEAKLDKAEAETTYAKKAEIPEAYDDSEIKAQLANKIEQSAIDTVKEELNNKILELTAKIEELTKKIQTEHPTTE